MFFPALLCEAAAMTVAAAVPAAAERLDYSCVYDVSALTDGSYETVVNIPESGVEITADKPVYGAYMVWNDLTACTIDYDGGWEEIPADYLHRFVPLGGKTAFRISPYEDTELCELYLYSEGEIPPEVQRWEPELSRCDILAMPTHADDEVLMFGGTLPYYAKELGLDVQVAYMTNHLDEQPRPHELLDSIWACGVTAYPIISEFPDIPCWSLNQALGVFDENAVTEFQVETIRRVKPSVIVAHDINGEYGHGAHMLNAYTLMNALELTADSANYPESAEKYGVWDVPKTYLHFWEENRIEMDWERPLESYGGITAREAAAYAYSFHKSQHKWGYSVNYAPYWDCRQFGLYRTLVGIDTTADFMENITPVSLESGEETETVVETENADPTASETEVPAETVPANETESKTVPESETENISKTIVENETAPPAETIPAKKAETADNTDESGGKTYVIGLSAVALVLVVCILAAIIISKVKK